MMIYQNKAIQISIATIFFTAALFVNGCAPTPAPTLTSAKPLIGPNATVPAIDPRDLNTLTVMIDQATEILVSDRFHKNLISQENRIPEVWISQKNKISSPSSISDSLRLQNSSQPSLRWAQVDAQLIGVAQKDASFYGGFAGNRNAYAGYGWKPLSGPQTGLISIGKVHLERFKSKDLVERSCAINTVSHELSHTLSDDQSYYNSYFVDTEETSGRPKGMAQASHLIGTVAQCTYLEDKGRILSSGFDECVDTFETSYFYGFACNDFEDGRKVNPQGRNPAERPSP